MNTNAPSTSRVKIAFIPVLVILACIGIGASLILSGSTYWLKGFLAIVSLAAAVILSIQLKRFSFYAVVLVVCGVLFLLSGVIQNEHDQIVRPLPVRQRIEFSKVIDPRQVSNGLENIGFGVVSFLLAFASLRLLPEESKGVRLLLLVEMILGVLFLVSGIASVVEELSKVCN